MTVSALPTAPALSISDFVSHWQGHRALTRRVIAAFPEEALFTFSVGGMRPFGVQATEIHLLSAMTVQAMDTGQWPEPDWAAGPATQAELLREWDALDERLSQVGAGTDPAFFSALHTLPWGNMPGWVATIYAVDNEIHHRAQGYVYLRALGVEPPAFYER
ncbi:DinB family protein [Deinococcus arcticus]|uniref:Damage-inducible protein DinB n=1 Tax=Deinococcus arcticus TaxID=2136176 RepID=A0A2T3WAA3_9DEIO|nr:DinB family protein [Deinococcus arcticus]PTA68767.1 damage-inducible protein DinB [Deinococcus arcticus]